LGLAVDLEKTHGWNKVGTAGAHALADLSGHKNKIGLRKVRPFGERAMGSSIEQMNWSTHDLKGREKYDSWVARLNETFGSWGAEANPDQNFSAEVSASKLPGLSLVECHCDPCGASRSRVDAGAIESEQLTLQLVISGREHMVLGNQEATLTSGDVFVWDNTQPMRFSVVEPLHKISLVLPLERLKSWAPNDWRDLPRHLKKDEPSAQLLGTYIKSLSQIDFQTNPMRYNALIEAAIALLVSPLQPKASEQSHRLAQLETVKSKIKPLLRDPDLDLEQIAARNRISLRYLHWLFEESETTPWRYVVQQRLAGCKRDLENPEHRSRSATEIAYSWGFSNSAHFGRKMKAEYGLSPSEMRAQVSRR